MSFNDRTTFIHLRETDDMDNYMPFGGATIAVQQQENGVQVGIAVCHEHDRYVKKEGRAKALGRLHSMSPDNARFRLHLEGVTADDIHAGVRPTGLLLLSNNEAEIRAAEAGCTLLEAVRKAGCKVL